MSLGAALRTGAANTEDLHEALDMLSHTQVVEDTGSGGEDDMEGDRGTDGMDGEGSGDGVRGGSQANESGDESAHVASDAYSHPRIRSTHFGFHESSGRSFVDFLGDTHLEFLRARRGDSDEIRILRFEAVVADSAEIWTTEVSGQNAQKVTCSHIRSRRAVAAYIGHSHSSTNIYWRNDSWGE
ncbi:hypothetical protein B0H19DRAFT_1061206 [Mycena capillaripes]|nr:hypothetical protein B0H19DRAFT_1061206 [Mycena capillaripes]